MGSGQWRRRSSDQDTWLNVVTVMFVSDSLHLTLYTVGYWQHIPSTLGVCHALPASASTCRQAQPCLARYQEKGGPRQWALRWTLRAWRVTLSWLETMTISALMLPQSGAHGLVRLSCGQSGFSCYGIVTVTSPVSDTIVQLSVRVPCTIVQCIPSLPLTNCQTYLPISGWIMQLWWSLTTDGPRSPPDAPWAPWSPLTPGPAGQGRCSGDPGGGNVSNGPAPDIDIRQQDTGITLPSATTSRHEH